jgi:prevent-host-death family protein
MTTSYSTYQAKARFSEVIRRVRAGQRVVITHHGREVAEIRPLEGTAGRSLEERVLEMEERGLVRPAGGKRRPWRAIARRPGALARFLAERD